MIKPTVILNYLLKENLISFFIIFIFCCFLFFTVDFIELLRRSSSKNIPISLIFKITFLHLPSLLPIILPTVFLLCSMNTFMKLNKNSELSIMRSSGLSIWFFMFPAILNCLIITILYVSFFNPIFSQMHIKFKSYEGSLFKGSTGLHEISPTGLWLREINQSNEFVINATHYSPGDNKLRNVIIFEFSENGLFKRRIDAEEVLMSEKNWQLIKVSVAKINQTPVYYEEMDIDFKLSIKKIEQNFRSPETINFWNLKKYIRSLEESGFTAKKHNIYFNYLLSFPLIVITMVLLGCILSIRKERKKKQYLNILIGIILGILFHFLTDITRTIGQNGDLSVFFAVWGVPIIAISILLGFLIHIEDG